MENVQGETYWNEAGAALEAIENGAPVEERRRERKGFGRSTAV